MATLMGKKVVVVGGSSGIGLGVAASALKSGAELVIVGRSPEKLQAAERTLGADSRVRTFAADMTKEAKIAWLFDEVGAFDHLVSTAGTPPPGDPIDRTDMDVVRRFVDNKLIGAVLLAKHAVRTLKTGGLNDLDFGDQQGSTAGSRRLGCIRDCRLIQLFCPRPVAGIGSDACEHRVARMGRHANVRRTRRRSQIRLL